MNLREMKIFKAVYDSESMTIAAKNLYVSQPAISKAIAAIESKLNLELFLREKGQIKRTTNADILYDDICDILIKVENLSNDISKKELVHLSTSITIGKTILADIIKKYKNDTRNIKITIANAKDIYTSILENKTDLAIIEGTTTDNELHAERIGNVELSFFQTKNNDTNNYTLKELLTRTILLRERGSSIREAFEGLLESKGLHYEPRWESVNSETIFYAVRNDLGIGLLPKVLINTDEFQLIEADSIKLNTPIELVIRKDKNLSHQEKLLIRLIKERYKKETL